MLCAMMQRREDPERPVPPTRTTEEYEVLMDEIVRFESEHFCPDENETPNARCRECTGRTEVMPVPFGTKTVPVAYCPNCTPQLRGHPAESLVYV